MRLFLAINLSDEMKDALRAKIFKCMLLSVVQQRAKQTENG